MTGTAANAERVRDYYRLVDAGRLADIYDLFDDDVAYRRPGVAPILGKDALVAFFEGPRGIEHSRHDVEIAAVDGDCVVVEGRVQATLTSGRTIDVRVAELFWFDGGRIVRRHGYVDAPLA